MSWRNWFRRSTPQVTRLFPGDVRVVKPLPGDVIAVLTSELFSSAEAAQLKAQMALAWPSNECVVLVAARDLVVIRGMEEGQVSTDGWPGPGPGAVGRPPGLE
jgi:hypothetical protein